MRYSNPTQPSQVFFKHYDIIRNAGLCVCVPLDEYHLCLSTVIGHYCMKNIVCCKITWPTNLHSVLTYFDQTLLDYFDRFCILFSSPGPFCPGELLPSFGVCRLLSVNFSHFKLLLRNHWADWNQTQQECSLGGPLQSFSFQSDIQYGCQGQ